eukprot:1771527-Prymnesium_polylepis.1
MHDAFGLKLEAKKHEKCTFLWTKQHEGLVHRNVLRDDGAPPCGACTTYERLAGARPGAVDTASYAAPDP